MGIPPFDPGPVPVVVEPAAPEGVTTIPVGWSEVQVIPNVGNTGRVGLSVVDQYGDSTTVALEPAAVDALLEALAAAAPVPYVPVVPDVQVLTPAGLEAYADGLAGRSLNPMELSEEALRGYFRGLAERERIRGEQS